MGQQITAIITNQNLEIDKTIVHFKEKNCTILPLDIHRRAVEYFINEAKKVDRMEDLVDLLESKNNWMEDPDSEHSLKTVVELISSLKLENFVIEYHSEYNSMEIDCYFIAVLNKKIIKESVMLCEYGLDKAIYNKFQELLGFGYWWEDENRYFRYDHALDSYEKQLGSS